MSKDSKKFIEKGDLTQLKDEVVVLQEYKKSDKKEVLKIYKDGFILGHKHLFPDLSQEYILEVKNWETIFKNLENKKIIIKVAKNLKGEIVGFVAFNKNILHTDFKSRIQNIITKLYLRKDYIGSGLAKSLLETAIAYFKPYSCSLLVLDKNLRAMKFYDKMGMIPREIKASPLPGFSLDSFEMIYVGSL